MVFRLKQWRVGLFGGEVSYAARAAAAPETSTDLTVAAVSYSPLVWFPDPSTYKRMRLRRRVWEPD